MIRRRALIGLWLAMTVSLPALAQEEKEYFALLMEGKKIVADKEIKTETEEKLKAAVEEFKKSGV